jgi:hypothetical protein
MELDPSTEDQVDVSREDAPPKKKRSRTRKTPSDKSKTPSVKNDGAQVSTRPINDEEGDEEGDNSAMPIEVSDEGEESDEQVEEDEEEDDEETYAVEEILDHKIVRRDVDSLTSSYINL